MTRAVDHVAPREVEPAQTQTPRVALHVDQIFADVPGGIGRMVVGLAEALPSFGVRTVPFAMGRPRSATTVPLRNVRFIGGPHGAIGHALWQYARRRIPLEADIVHAPSLAVPRTRDRLVVSIPDVAFVRHPEWFTRRGVAFHNRGLELARRTAHMIITPSQFTASELVDLGFDSERIRVVPLASMLPPTRNACDARLPYFKGLEDRPIVLLVGTIEPRKGHHLALEAMRTVRRRIPDALLVVAGAPGWRSRELLAELRGDHGTAVLGHVSDSDLDALYRRADVVITPSRYEGFGLPIVEAASRGSAVLASDIPSHREILGPTSAALVPGNDPSLWADALVRLLAHEPGLAAANRAAVHRAVGRRTVNDVAAEHVEIYFEVLAQPR